MIMLSFAHPFMLTHSAMTCPTTLRLWLENAPQLYGNSLHSTSLEPLNNETWFNVKSHTFYDFATAWSWVLLLIILTAKRDNHNILINIKTQNKYADKCIKVVIRLLSTGLTANAIISIIKIVPSKIKYERLLLVIIFVKQDKILTLWNSTEKWRVLKWI